MEPVSSVAAFLARYGERGGGDAQAAEVLDVLAEEERRALSPRSERQAEVGDGRGLAGREHARRRAEIRLRRELQRRGLWAA